MKKIKFSKKIDIIWKASMVFELVWIVVGVVIYFIFNTELLNNIFIIVFFLDAIVFIGLPQVVEDFNPSNLFPEGTANKILIDIPPFESFLQQSEEAIKKQGLAKIESKNLNIYEYYVYTNPRPVFRQDIVLIVKAEEITYETFAHSVNMCMNAIGRYFKTDYSLLSGHKNITKLYYIDRMNSDFEEGINIDAGILQRSYISKDIIAISGEENVMYMLKSHSHICRGKFKRIRKKFHKYFGFLTSPDKIPKR